MYLSGESLLIILVVGLVAGWLAGQIVHGTGFGIIGDIAIGIVGAFIGSWLFPRLGIHLGAGIIASIINATLGAVILLLIIRLVRGGGDGEAVGGGEGVGSRPTEVPEPRSTIVTLDDPCTSAGLCGGAGVLGTRRRQIEGECGRKASASPLRRGLDGVGLVVEDHAQERGVHLEVPIVFDEAQAAEFVHEMADTRPGGADHVGKGFPG